MEMMMLLECGTCGATTHLDRAADPPTPRCPNGCVGDTYGVTNTNTNANSNANTNTNTKETAGIEGEMDSPAPEIASSKDVPEMRLLLEDYESNEISPIDVELGPLPESATRLERAIAQDMKLRIGLQRAVDDHRPLIYACREAVRAGLTKYPMQAARAIDRLVEARTIDLVGTLPKNGVRLYAVPVLSDELRKVAVETTSTLGVANEAMNPIVELVKDSLVARAEFAVANRRVFASREGAGHACNDSSR